MLITNKMYIPGKQCIYNVKQQSMNQPIFTQQIETISDVKSFFKYLLIDLNLSFTVDETFHNYKNDIGQLVFNTFMAEKLDWQMITCMTVCYAEETDIYRIAFEAYVEHNIELFNHPKISK